MGMGKSGWMSCGPEDANTFLEFEDPMLGGFILGAYQQWRCGASIIMLCRHDGWLRVGIGSDSA